MTRFDIRKVVEDAVDDINYHIDEDDRHDLNVRVWPEACKINTTINNTCGIIKIVCKLRIKHRHTHDVSIPSNVKVSQSSNESLDVDHAISCRICLEDIDGGIAGDKAYTLSCSHVFHVKCINQWMRSSRFCPICRHDIPT